MTEALLERARSVQERLVKYRAAREATSELRGRVEARLSELQAEERQLINEQFLTRAAYEVLADLLRSLSEPRKQSLIETVNKALQTAAPKHRYRMTIRDVHHEGLGWIANFFLEDSSLGRDLDPKYQSGEAVKQLISFVVILTFLAYAKKAPFLLLDEALSGINGRRAQEIGQILHRLALENNFQVVLINQNPQMFRVPGARYLYLALDDVQQGLTVKVDKILQREDDVED